jgi:hypothetical protein
LVIANGGAADSLDEAKAAFRSGVGSGAGSRRSCTIRKPRARKLRLAGSGTKQSFLPVCGAAGSQRKSGRFIFERDQVVSREKYLRFAAECWAVAETMDDPSSQAQLLATAATWRKLAEFASSPDSFNRDDECRR